MRSKVEKVTRVILEFDEEEFRHFASLFIYGSHGDGRDEFDEFARQLDQTLRDLDD